MAVPLSVGIHFGNLGNVGLWMHVCKTAVQIGQ